MSGDAMRSFVLKRLPAWHRRLKRLGLERVSKAGQDYVAGAKVPLKTRLHGYDAWLNQGNPYPFVMVEQINFNHPLKELLRQVHRQLGRPICAIDVGASIGNTALLLMSLGEEKIESLDCVEGNQEFFTLLERNTARFPNVRRHLAMLARSEGTARTLVHHHPGTAGASGSELTQATTLDSLLLGQLKNLDFLKVDIDGSDGEALSGARGLLERDQPAVIFEWHPYLLQEAGNEPFAAFTALQAAGYERFLWYTNKGDFSHFGGTESSSLENWRRFLIEMHPHGDPHFDIVALPKRFIDLQLSLLLGGPSK